MAAMHKQNQGSRCTVGNTLKQAQFPIAWLCHPSVQDSCKRMGLLTPQGGTSHLLRPVISGSHSTGYQSGNPAEALSTLANIQAIATLPAEPPMYFHAVHSLNPECMATTPPVRFSYVTALKPASRIWSAQRSCINTHGHMKQHVGSVVVMPLLSRQRAVPAITAEASQPPECSCACISNERMNINCGSSQHQSDGCPLTRS